MQTFGNKKQHSIFFLFPLLFFAVLLFVLSFKFASANVFYSQNSTDVFYKFINAGSNKFIRENNFITASTTATTTIEKIDVVINPSIANSCGYTIYLFNQTRLTFSAFNQTILENENCLNASTTDSAFTLNYSDGFAEMGSGDVFSLVFPYYTNSMGDFKWYGTNIGTTTVSECSMSSDDLAGFTNPLCLSGIKHFSFALLTDDADIWKPNFTSPDLSCESWDFGGLGIGLEICKALSFLFLPDSNHLNMFGDLFDTLANKPPFGYYTEIKNALLGINASSTPAFLFSAIGAIQTDIFTPIDFGIAGILWLFFAIWVIKRIGEFVP
jgi:hypothetical protein